MFKVNKFITSLNGVGKSSQSHVKGLSSLVKMPKLDLIIVGHIMIETIYMRDGKVVGPVLGSPAAYSSVSASLLGTPTGLVTTIGKDMPYYIVSPIIEAGVDTKGICIKGENSRSTKLTYDEAGNKEVSYEKVAPNILFKDIPKEYLKSIAFFVCPMDFEVPLETISELKKLNKLLMTDLGGFGGTVSTIHPSSGSENDEMLVRDIVGKFNIVKASIEDCCYLFKGSVSYKEAVQILHNWGVEIVIITLGEKGSVISKSNNLINIPVFRTKTVDTTGAGDVYCAAFLSEYLRTRDLYKSGLYASAAASILTEKTGGVTLSRMPIDEKVRERLRSFLSN